MAIRLRHRSRGQCSCGWIGESRLFLSSAKCDALIHAAQSSREPAIPFVEPTAITAPKPPGMLVVALAAGCGETSPAPLKLTDSRQDGLLGGNPGARFVAVVPELHNLVFGT